MSGIPGAPAFRSLARRIRPSCILLPSAVFLFALLLVPNLLRGQPSGWDYFYHARVLRLTEAQQRLLPFDPLSAGGRVQTYQPFYYSIVLAAHLSTGLPSEFLLRLASPVFLALAAISIFVFLGRTWTAALAAVIFAAFPEVLLFSSSSGMPSVASLFPLSMAIAILSRGDPFPASTLAILSVLVGALHPLSAIVLVAFVLCAFVFRSPGRRRTPGQSALLCLAALSIPLAWGAAFPTIVPSWGVHLSIPALLQSVGLPHALTSILVPFSGAPVLAFSVLLLAASLRFPVLPSRFVLYLAFPVSLAASSRRWGAFFATALILIFLARAQRTVDPVWPIMQEDDLSALLWIDSNLPQSSVVAGHTDFSSVFLMGHSTTIIDGFSEGVPDALRRQADIRLAYESDDFSVLREKYGAKYVFTDKAEERLLKRTVAPEGPELFDNGYSKVLKLSAGAPS